MDIEDYMQQEVLPYVPDAKAFFEENLNVKKPIKKTWAEIPFTKYFYKYEEPIASDELERQFKDIEAEIQTNINNLF